MGYIVWGFLAYFVAFLAGVFTVLVSIWYFVYEDKEETHIRIKPDLELKLPESVTESLKSQESYKKRETCLSLNLILQFFFQEKQHDTEIRLWLTDLISQELCDLLKHKALSKIINKMEIQDLNLGHNFPVIKAATPVNIQFVQNSTLLKKIEINVEVEYTGGFRLAINAITKLAKKAVVKIKVVRLSGRGCLEFSRYPFTHWSFSFYEEPEVEFEVESTVLGRHVPRFKSIIISQLKGLIYKKHTLPNYKLRGPPLVGRRATPSLESYFSVKRNISDIPGKLFITLLKCTRLQASLVGSSIYFSLTLSEAPLICAYETPVGIWIIQDIVIERPQHNPIGILLRTADDNSQIIETVSSKSAAALAGLRRNDIVLTVNNIPLVSGAQAAKLFSSSSLFTTTKVNDGSDCQVMCIRIKRLVFTDHKRSSLDNKNLFEPVISPEDPPSSPVFSSSPSVQSVPASVDDDISESISLTSDAVEKISYPVSIQGDKVTFSVSNNLKNSKGEGSISTVSTPESSRSNSPELKPKNQTVSSIVPDLSPIHSCDEESAKIESNETRPSASSDWEQFPLASSVPIQIPGSSNKTSLTALSPEGQSYSTQTSRAGTPTSQTFEFVPQMVPGMPIVKMDVKNMSKKVSSKNRSVLKHFETAPIAGSCDPILGNDFEFHIEEESRYVNICVWSKNLPVDDEKGPTSPVEQGEKVASAKEVIRKFRKKDNKEVAKESERKSSKDLVRTFYSGSPVAVTGHPDHVLVGHVNLNIEDITQETALNTQGYVTKILTLQPADPNCPELAEHPLLQHVGFDPKLCYGDVTLAITHQPKNKLPLSPKNLGGSNPAASEDDSTTDVTQSDEEDPENSQDQREKDHDFKRTHFHSATHCSFCKKKIWLKDAYQCSECGIICHKKCMLRCEQATVCDFGGLRYREIKDPLLTKSETKLTSDQERDMPEIIMTSAGDSPISKRRVKKTPPPSPPSPRHTLGSLLSHISATSGSMKRTGSAHNLAPNIGSNLTLSRSLPPSPQHSPRSSRKASLSGNPFLREEDSEGKHLETILERLLIYPHDERLVILARESATQLYSQLSREERLVKIKHELEILQSRVDREGEIRVDLALQEREASEKNDSLKRTKLSLLISECDARTQALALLTMHYFTALQLVQNSTFYSRHPTSFDFQQAQYRSRGVRREARSVDVI